MNLTKWELSVLSKLVLAEYNRVMALPTTNSPVNAGELRPSEKAAWLAAISELKDKIDVASLGQ